jgi:hypothetical protein
MRRCEGVIALALVVAAAAPARADDQAIPDHPRGDAAGEAGASAMVPVAPAEPPPADQAQVAGAARAPVPRLSRPITHEDRRLFSIGASVFVIAYGGAVFAASDSFVEVADTSPAHGELWIPVYGPFASLGGGRGVAADALLVVDGLAQLGGLALIGYAIACPDHGGGARVTVAPALGAGPGLVAFGRF